MNLLLAVVILAGAVAVAIGAMWVDLPDELAAALEAALGPREDRDPQARLFRDSGSDALRTVDHEGV